MVEITTELRIPSHFCYSFDWKDHELGDLYKTLFALKKSNTALWNGKWGATMIHIHNSAPASVFSFVRQNNRDKVFGVFNFSNEAQAITFSEGVCHGNYTEYFSQQQVALLETTQVQLEPWGYRVFVK